MIDPARDQIIGGRDGYAEQPGFDSQALLLARMPPSSEAVSAMIDALESIRRFIWHGNGRRPSGSMGPLRDRFRMRPWCGIVLR